MTMTMPAGGYSEPFVADDAERLDAALQTGAAEALPARLRDLAVVATDLAAVLRSAALSPSERERIAARTSALVRRRRTARLLGIRAARQRPAVAIASASGAAVGLAVLGLALLRRSHPVVRHA